MWANLSGVEVLSNTVVEFLIPTQNTTVIEVGCGSGVMSILLASVSLLQLLDYRMYTLSFLYCLMNLFFICRNARKS